MQKDFELNLNGQTTRFSARTGTAHDVGIFETGATTPCVVLTESNALERMFGRLVDNEELIDIAISQATRQGLIERAREGGNPVHEALAFVPNPL
jgi:hypothetical protein